LDGVVERHRDGLLDWRYRGRLVARQLDDSRIVIRASFDFRDSCSIRSPRRSPVDEADRPEANPLLLAAS
jgi:hypothetical protein